MVIYRSLETGGHRSRSLETGGHRSRLDTFLNARVAVARKSLVSVIPRPMTPGRETNDPSVTRPITNGLESLGFRRVAGTDNFLPTTQRTCEHYCLPLKTASLTSWRRFGEVFSILSLFLPFPHRNSVLYAMYRSVPESGIKSEHRSRQRSRSETVALSQRPRPVSVSPRPISISPRLVSARHPFACVSPITRSSRILQAINAREFGKPQDLGTKI